MKNIYMVLILFPVLMLSGCNPDSPVSVLFSPPNVSIVSNQEVDATSSSFAQFKVTVQNDGGGATAYNVGCTIKLKNGNYIVESETGFFGTLQSGESTSDAVWFTNIKTKSDYQSSEIQLYWWDSQGDYYQN